MSGCASLAGRADLADTDGDTDAINAAAVTTGSTLDLRAGNTSTIAGQAVAVAAGTIIENAFGGDGDDTLIGVTGGLDQTDFLF